MALSIGDPQSPFILQVWIIRVGGLDFCGLALGICLQFVVLKVLRYRVDISKGLELSLRKFMVCGKA